MDLVPAADSVAMRRPSARSSFTTIRGLRPAALELALMGRAVRRLQPMRAPLLLLLTAVTVMSVGAAEASACRCSRSSLDQKWRQADGAIVGRLVAVTPFTDNAPGATLRYRLERVYKGGRRLRRARAVTILGGRTSCSLPTRPLRRRDALFLRLTSDGWSAGRCSRVSPALMRRAAQGGRGRAKSRCRP